jgi:uncharacterized protein
MRFWAMILTIAIITGQGFGRPPQSSGASGIEGDWQGTLRAGSNELRLVVHISKAPQGFLQATLDSLDEDTYGIPITSITFENSKLDFSADSIDATYEGHANSDLSVINGSWTQAGNNLALQLKRGAAPGKSEH